MLTHSNLLYQLNNLRHFLQPAAGDTSLSLLPPWHIYERSCGYFIYCCGMKQVYTNIRRFREDLTKFPPQYFVCVPLVIDTLQTKVGEVAWSCAESALPCCEKRGSQQMWTARPPCLKTTSCLETTADSKFGMPWRLNVQHLVMALCNAKAILCVQSVCPQLCSQVWTCTASQASARVLGAIVVKLEPS